MSDILNVWDLGPVALVLAGGPFILLGLAWLVMTPPSRSVDRTSDSGSTDRLISTRPSQGRAPQMRETTP